MAAASQIRIGNRFLLELRERPSLQISWDADHRIGFRRHLVRHQHTHQSIDNEDQLRNLCRDLLQIEPGELPDDIWLVLRKKMLSAMEYALKTYKSRGWLTEQWNPDLRSIAYHWPDWTQGWLRPEWDGNDRPPRTTQNTSSPTPVTPTSTELEMDVDMPDASALHAPDPGVNIHTTSYVTPFHRCPVRDVTRNQTETEQEHTAHSRVADLGRRQAEDARQAEATRLAEDEDRLRAEIEAEVRHRAQIEAETQRRRTEEEDAQRLARQHEEEQARELRAKQDFDRQVETQVRLHLAKELSQLKMEEECTSLSRQAKAGEDATRVAEAEQAVQNAVNRIKQVEETAQRAINESNRRADESAKQIELAARREADEACWREESLRRRRELEEIESNGRVADSRNGEHGNDHHVDHSLPKVIVASKASHSQNTCVTRQQIAAKKPSLCAPQTLQGVRVYISGPAMPPTPPSTQPRNELLMTAAVAASSPTERTLRQDEMPRIRDHSSISSLASLRNIEYSRQEMLTLSASLEDPRNSSVAWPKPYDLDLQDPRSKPKNDDNWNAGHELRVANADRNSPEPALKDPRPTLGSPITAHSYRLQGRDSVRYSTASSRATGTMLRNGLASPPRTPAREVGPNVDSSSFHLHRSSSTTYKFPPVLTVPVQSSSSLCRVAQSSPIKNKGLFMEFAGIFPASMRPDRILALKQQSVSKRARVPVHSPPSDAPTRPRHNSHAEDIFGLIRQIARASRDRIASAIADRTRQSSSSALKLLLQQRQSEEESYMPGAEEVALQRKVSVYLQSGKYNVFAVLLSRRAGLQQSARFEKLTVAIHT